VTKGLALGAVLGGLLSAMDDTPVGGADDVTWVVIPDVSEGGPVAWALLGNADGTSDG
jgi:hypothetical protein